MRSHYAFQQLHHILQLSMSGLEEIREQLLEINNHQQFIAIQETILKLKKRIRNNLRKDMSGPRVISTFLIDPTQVESKKSSQIQWPVPSINAKPVDVFLGEE